MARFVPVTLIALVHHVLARLAWIGAADSNRSVDLRVLMITNALEHLMGVQHVLDIVVPYPTL